MITEENLIPLLQSDDRQEQLRAIRALKNAVIGHAEEKAQYLDRGVLSDLLRVISTTEDGVQDPLLEECRTQAAIVLGSFAYSDSDISLRLFNNRTISTLISILSPNSPSQLLLAALRTLTTLLGARPTPSLSLHYPTLTQKIGQLLSHFHAQYFAKFARQDALVLTQLCLLVPLMVPPAQSTSAARNPLGLMLVRQLASLVRHVVVNNRSSSFMDAKLQSASILALSHVLTAQDAYGLASSDPEFSAALLQLLRAPATDTRLAAATLLTTLYTSGLTAVSESRMTLAPQNMDLALTLVPTLMKLLDDSLAADEGESCDPRILQTFAVVCREGGEVADRCVESGLIKKVVSIVARAAPNNHIASGRISDQDSKRLAGGLLCLSALGLYNEEYRKTIVDANGLAVVVSVLNTENTTAVREIKIAACNLLRTLCRSVALLRTTMVESGIVSRVMDLVAENYKSKDSMDQSADEDGRMIDEGMLRDGNGDRGMMGSEDAAAELEHDENDQDLQVRTAAMAAVCNLVLDFSPLQKPILDKEMLPLIVSGARSRYTPLRLNSVWALKHMVYVQDPQTKNIVLETLGFPLLMQLCDDEEMQVQEQALDFLRNMTARAESFVSKLFNEVGVDEVFAMLERKLVYLPKYPEQGYGSVNPIEVATAAALDKPYQKIVSIAVYILVHIAAGYDYHRQSVIAHESVLRRVVKLMSHESFEVRLACIWVILNLTDLEERQDPVMDMNDVSELSAEYTPPQQQPESIHYKDAMRERATMLLRLGVREQLDVLKLDPQLDVREKAKLAIYQLGELASASGVPAVSPAGGSSGTDGNTQGTNATDTLRDSGASAMDVDVDAGSAGVGLLYF
ncbi:armadillo-type protein [Limtongia smithiae]|uniref:armadillo-type protein n=1 Tax=Limtongia smithiae TaxID=1125753 RepID=UPI0034CD279C